MPSVKQPKRNRAIAAPYAGVGASRYRLYAKAWKRIKQAICDEYYLEAITLLESILTDRMESRASYLKQTNQGFQNLGDLINTLRISEQVDELKAILGVIDAWRIRRNKAIHEMVKFEEGTVKRWEQSIAGLQSIAEDGQCILKEFDRIDIQERKKNGARPAATEPGVFE